MAHLSTHVLDVSRGSPAAEVAIDLLCAGKLAGSYVTNADGRVGAIDVAPGVYDLVFHAGAYFRAQGLALADPPFLDEVVIRFGIAEGRYHVPLLLSPYGYSTYRGS